MELVIILTVRFRKMLFINLFKIVKIVWTFRINTLMYSKEFAVFLRRKSVGTMRTVKLVSILKFLWIAR